jgi:hypothetical protein
MARTTQLHKVTRADSGGRDSNCTFCGQFIYRDARHYHVDNVGDMCIPCLDLSYITLKGVDSYVELTYTIVPSRAFRII